MLDLDIKTNIICRFNGLTWDDQQRKGISYEEYMKNERNKNSDFTIDLSLFTRNEYSYRKMVDTVYLTVHFSEFPNDYTINTSTDQSYSIFFEDEEEVKNFLYEYNITQYIKDELNYWCGETESDLMDKIISVLVETMVVL